jgi:hypothetical protein
MPILRQAMDWRPVGSGYFTRRPDMASEYMTICRICAFFWTAETFPSTLPQQPEDAERKHRVGRGRVFERVTAKPEGEGEPQRPRHLTGVTT